MLISEEMYILFCVCVCVTSAVMDEANQLDIKVPFRGNCKKDEEVQ